MTSESSPLENQTGEHARGCVLGRNKMRPGRKLEAGGEKTNTQVNVNKPDYETTVALSSGGPKYVHHAYQISGL